MNRLVSFLLVLAILGFIIGALNKGARAIGFFIALLAIVLLIGTPGSGNLNFFANLFNGDTAGAGAGNGTTSAPQTTQQAPAFGNGQTGNAQTGSTSAAGGSQTASAPQANPRDLPSQPLPGARTRATGTTTGTGATGTTGATNRSTFSQGSSGRPRALW
jgi:hypothetical protein